MYRDGGIEPALRPQYSEEIKKGLWRELGQHQLPRDLVWIDARNITLKKHINGVLFPVSTRNDELLIVRDFYGTPQNGAILGVEPKKRLTWQVHPLSCCMNNWACTTLVVIPYVGSALVWSMMQSW